MKELKVTAKLRKVKDYKHNSKDKLTKIPSEPESKICIEKIRKNQKNYFETKKVL